MSLPHGACDGGGGPCWDSRLKCHVPLNCDKCKVQAEVTIDGRLAICALCFSECRGAKCKQAREAEEDRRRAANLLIPLWAAEPPTPPPAAAAAPPTPPPAAAVAPTTPPPPAAAAAPPTPPPLPAAGSAADRQIAVMTDLAEIRSLLANIMASLQEDQHGTGHAGRRQDWCQEAGPPWYDEDCRQQQGAQQDTGHVGSQDGCQDLGPPWYQEWLAWRGFRPAVTTVTSRGVASPADSARARPSDRSCERTCRHDCHSQVAKFWRGAIVDGPPVSAGTLRWGEPSLSAVPVRLSLPTHPLLSLFDPPVCHDRPILACTGSSRCVRTLPCGKNLAAVNRLRTKVVP
jgi:hypothetical protein